MGPLVPVLAVFLAAPAAAGTPRLVLVGGGEKPAAALERFVSWSGGPKARLLMVGWASGEPGTAESLVDEFKPLAPAAVDAAPSTAAVLADRAAFEGLLSSATGVFFSGGDQVRLMSAVETLGLASRFKAMAAAGVVFGGTSAGTAVMSQVMITGEGDFTHIDPAKVETGAGLGLLPADVIVDQHFLRRQRENRLFALVLARQGSLGVGVDQDTALLVDGDVGEVVGPAPVMVVRPSGPDALDVELVRPGGRYDLAARRPLAR